MNQATPTASPQQPAAQGRHVAVEAKSAQTPGDTAAFRRIERHAVERRLQDAAGAAALDASPLVGGLLLVSALLAGVLIAADAGAALAPWGWAWAVATVATVAALMLPLRRRGREAAAVRWVPALAWLAAACLVAPAWLVSSQARPALIVAVAMAAVASTSVLAMRPAAAIGFSLVPLVSSLALATAWVWPIVGLLGSGLSVAVGIMRRRGWRKQTRALIEQGEQLRRLERERNDAQRTDHEKSRFLAIASHDLRQPVHALGLFAATLERRLQQSADEPLARNLMRAVDGLERSFNAMLDISKLDAGALLPRPESFALRDMFRRLHMQYGGQAEFAGLGLRFSPGGKTITSDPQLLERIVGNLIQNAIKYTAAGGIAVVARSTASCVNVEVWDTGCGIAAADLPFIFDEFYQVGSGERDRSHGLGMGLAIVKRLGSLLGHRVEVCSTPGRGTMFRIGVPVGGSTGIQEDLNPADTQPMTIEVARMVLVVDDEEPIREGMRLMLQEWGYQVMTAANATQAELAVTALEGHVDLVVSDLNLGNGADGTAVVNAVRRLCGREVPAILITGETGHDRIQHLAAGEDPLLLKPVQPRRLFDALRAALH